MVMFSNLIAVLLLVLTALPQSARGIRARRRRPPLTNHLEKPTMVSLSVVFIFFPPIQCFLMVVFSN
jgi:hypothetical protein